jgi:hypothetical protein
LHPYNPGRGNGGGTMPGGQEDRSEREQKDEKDIYAEKLEITVFFFIYPFMWSHVKRCIRSTKGKSKRY